MLYSGTLNGLYYPVRRDCPEILLPDAGTSAGMTPGVIGANAAADTLSAYGEICSTTEFGTSPLLIIGMIATMRAGDTITAQIATLPRPRLAIFEIASGTASNESMFMQIPFGASAYVQMLNWVDDPIVSALAIGNSVLYLEGPPKLIAASTRLAYRLEMHDTWGQRISACYAVAYDPTKLVFSNNPPINFDQMLRGGGTFTPVKSDYATATSSTSAGVNGAYVTINVNGGATLDSDYLIVGMTFSPEVNNVTATHKMADLAIGTAGNEVVQARTGVGGVVIQYGGVHHQFKYPVIAFKGETLRWAVRDSSLAALDYDIILRLVRLGS